MADLKLNFRVTFTPVRGSRAGQKITRTFVAVSAQTAEKSCLRMFPGCTVSSSVESENQ